MLRITTQRGERVKFYLAIISAGRPENVGPMTEQVGAATWYVPQDEVGAYHQAGAGAFGEGSRTHVVPVRNRAMEDAWRMGAMCVQLDDDLKWAAVAAEGKAERHRPARVIELLVRRAHHSDFKLAGASPTDNAYFTRQENSTQLFARSGVWAIKENPLRLDENLRVKFDYDYCLQHIATFGGVLRCDDLLFHFQQRSASGGHSEDWKSGVNEQAIRYLLAKWPDRIKRHPRRRGEVMLAVPRRKREVLT